MVEKKEITCTDCYVAITEIKTTLNLLRADLMKIIISMLGMIAAQIGVKYLGTPWYLYIMVYVSIVTSVFLIVTTILAWNKIPVLWRILAFMLAGMFSLAAACRIWAYNFGIPLSQHVGIVMQLFYAFVGFLVCIIFWRNGRWSGEERRQNP